jgi:predicted nucleic acid-binding protein
MIVLDASVVVDLLLGTPSGKEIADRIADPDQTLHAPELLDLEVARVLRRYEAARTLSAERGRAALHDLLDLDVERYGHGPLLPRIWELRPNLTAYDAAYVALAEALGAVLLTRDARIAAAPGHRARVERVT